MENESKHKQFLCGQHIWHCRQNITLFDRSEKKCRSIVDDNFKCIFLKETRGVRTIPGK